MDSGEQEVIIAESGRDADKFIVIEAEEARNADLLYGLLADYEDKNVTVGKIRDERIRERYGDGD